MFCVLTGSHEALSGSGENSMNMYIYVFINFIFILSTGWKLGANVTCYSTTHGAKDYMMVSLKFKAM